jgi:hypothetical protein
MAVGTYSVTVNSGVNKIWRKVQGDLQTALQFECEEWEMLDDLKEFDIDWSQREITVPIDINEGAGVASIAEGGDEARPSSPNAEEITLTWSHFVKRFTISKMARWIDQKDREAQIERQIVFQGRHGVRDLQRHYSDYSYGFTTAYLARTTATQGAASSHTLTLDDAYGVAGIDTAAYIGAMFKVGDYVALIQSAALVMNAIGVITAVTPGTPSIAVTWNGSVSVTEDDYVVKANSLENTTVAGTDYSRGLTGWLDATSSTSVHSLSSSSVANWSVAYSDTASGRFTGRKLRRAKQEIANEGGGKANFMLIDQAVYRDLIDTERAAVRFDNPFGMEIDGDVKAKGFQIHQTRRVPPGYVFVADKKSVRKMTLLPKPGQPAWDDAYKLQDKSGYVFCLDYPVAQVFLNRKNLAVFSNQTQS